MQKMNKKGKKNNKITSSKNQKTLGYYIPIIFIIAIIPLIVHGKIVELPLEVANFWKGGTTHIDFFNYYKFIGLIIGTVAALMAFSGLALNNKLSLQKEKRYYIPMIVYGVFVILSTIMSSNKQVAVEGFIEMNQGIFVLINYIVLTFILMNYVTDERDIKIIVYSFAALIIIEGLIGLSQYFGHDFFQTSLGQWLISPEPLKGTELKFTFGKYTIYATMYNTNFVGSFAALVMPISIVLYLYAKDRKNTIIFALVALMAFILWVGCNSRAGYLGVLTAFIPGIIIFRKVIKEKYKKVLIPLIGVIILVFAFNTVSNGRVFNQFSRLLLSTETKKLESIQANNSVKFEDVSIEGNKLTIKTNKETFVAIADEGKLNFYDEENNPIGLKIDNEGNISFEDERYSQYKFNVSSARIKAKVYGRNLDLYFADNQLKVVSINGKLTVPEEAPRVKFFDGKETFASNRGYIWSRTIPMMKDTFFIGYGPDHYPMVFPQEDYVGRFNVGGSGMLGTVIDKPHNMYMQTAINTGVISLIALAVIWVIYIADSIKIYLKGNLNSFAEYMGAATFLSITAYLVAGIFNDSVISVAPLFWVLLGTGIGVNKIVRDNKEVNN